ncbi:hypothetical protein GHT06_003571 [Daphnia sinensis]|uniref:Rhodanese domain-containing protein n=1 Tax=Daphnia sinensis TaxID=1820382 RepID=A0AAD5PMK7_9CRUS|nr:hypothetical protein GHT06_003571 [Daphnia sinensis]
MAQIDKNKTYYVHCAGGYRSMIFNSVLRARGFDNLIDVKGGFKAIKESDRCDESHILLLRSMKTFVKKITLIFLFAWILPFMGVLAQHESIGEHKDSKDSTEKLFGKVLESGLFEFHLRSYFMATVNQGDLTNYSTWGTGAGLGISAQGGKGLVWDSWLVRRICSGALEVYRSMVYAFDFEGLARMVASRRVIGFLSTGRNPLGSFEDYHHHLDSKGIGSSELNMNRKIGR